MKRLVAQAGALILFILPLFSGGAGLVQGDALPPAVEVEATEDPASVPAPIEFPSHPLMGDVKFPHQEHIDDLEISCGECHHEINAAGFVTPHDEYFEDFWIKCQICHAGSVRGGAEPEACSNCHHSRHAGSGDQTLSTKVVVHQLCWSCHDSGTGVEASASCEQCHTGAEYGQ